MPDRPPILPVVLVMAAVFYVSLGTPFFAFPVIIVMTMGHGRLFVVAAMPAVLVLSHRAGGTEREQSQGGQRAAEHSDHATPPEFLIVRRRPPHKIGLFIFYFRSVAERFDRSAGLEPRCSRE